MRRHVSLQTTVNSKPTTVSCGSQATTICKSEGTQCRRLVKDASNGHGVPVDLNSSTDHDDHDDSDPYDPDWTPTTDPDKATKYIVFEASVMELLDVCGLCSRTGLSHQKTVIGTCLCVSSQCRCGFQRQWASQPFSKAMPWGNLIVTAAAFCSGSSSVKILNFLKHAGIAGLGKTSFNILQGNYIVPSVLSYWQYMQNLYLQSIKDKGHHLKLGGDARCSSPGHTAKYGSYTFMDVETSKVIYIQLVHCNEVKNSNAMELEGLKRGLQFLKDEQIVVSDFITDRHVQVKKLMREEHPDIRHWFDVWHVAKGMFNEVIILCTKA